jgi:hypothetical protein
LDVSDLEEPEQQTMIIAHFDSLVIAFNQTKPFYIIVIDSASKDRAVRMKMGRTHYVSTNKTLLWTGIDLAILSINIFLIPAPYGIIPFYLMPAAHSKIDFTYSPDLHFTKPSKAGYINPNGFWRKKSKQKIKLVRRFDRMISKYLKELHQQYMISNNLIVKKASETRRDDALQ